MFSCGGGLPGRCPTSTPMHAFERDNDANRALKLRAPNLPATIIAAFSGACVAGAKDCEKFFVRHQAFRGPGFELPPRTADALGLRLRRAATARAILPRPIRRLLSELPRYARQAWAARYDTGLAKQITESDSLRTAHYPTADAAARFSFADVSLADARTPARCC